MPDQVLKTTKLLVKLNRLTSTGDIKWIVRRPPRALVEGTDDVVPIFLIAEYKDRKLGLFQHRYPSYDGENDRHYWAEELVLVIIDEDDRILWEVKQPYSALSDLFETARRRVANVDALIDTLLKEDEDTEVDKGIRS